jgi:RNA polymerase sigma factor (sigma-70 family)
MPTYRLDSLRQLARQMQFTPHEARATQLDAAEELLHLIDPAKTYPLEFVIYRITGYRPKRAGRDLLDGGAIQHDLGRLVEEISSSMDLSAASVAQPVLAIEDVCQTLNVTSKTIQRWRRRGLPARRLVFADGRKRVGFLLSSVERFLAAHGDQVASDANLSVLGPGEMSRIVRHARRLAVEGHCTEDQIARRIARRFRRSALTILHVLRKHDREHADEAVLSLAAPPVHADDRAAVVEGHRAGQAPASLARRLGRPRATIYDIIMQDRLAAIRRSHGRFIDDPLYHQSGAAGIIEQILQQDPISPEPPDSRVPRDLPPYLQDLCRIPMLPPAKLRGLFLKLHLHKRQFALARRRLDPELARHRQLRELECSLQQAGDVKNQIVAANLRLVVSVARKHLRPGLSLMDLVSDGNLALMRAVDSFDIHRGFAFSTYATWALMRSFARSAGQQLAARRAAGADADADVLRAVADVREAATAQGRVDREYVRSLLKRLGERERAIMEARFGVGRQDGPATYATLGQRLGLSRERIRQIERGAMEKLRAAGQP